MGELLVFNELEGRLLSDDSLNMLFGYRDNVIDKYNIFYDLLFHTDSVPHGEIGRAYIQANTVVPLIRTPSGNDYTFELNNFANSYPSYSRVGVIDDEVHFYRIHSQDSGRAIIPLSHGRINKPHFFDCYPSFRNYISQDIRRIVKAYASS